MDQVEVFRYHYSAPVEREVLDIRAQYLPLLSGPVKADKYGQLSIPPKNRKDKVKKMSVKGFFKKAFSDMKESAKAQHEVDKAQFEAVKAESKANFEENKGHNTFAKAKADAKKSWDDAHMSPSERQAKMQQERQAKIADAKDRTEKANERYEAAKKKD